ncbi:hypothetical protein GCM10020218_018140 [Dactylosporangium vinaceum]
MASCLEHSGQAVSVRAGAFDGPEHPLAGGKVLAGPGQQPDVAVWVGADLGLGMDLAEGVDQCGGMGVGVSVDSDDPSASIRARIGGLACLDWHDGGCPS